MDERLILAINGLREIDAYILAYLLNNQEGICSHIAEYAHKHVANVHKRLHILENAGIIEDHGKRNRPIYSLKPEWIKNLVEWDEKKRAENL